MDMSLSKLGEMVKDKEACFAEVCGVTKSQSWHSNWTATTNVLILGQWKSNCSLALLKSAIWYWNAFLNKYGYVIHHFNVLYFYFLLMTYYAILCLVSQSGLTLCNPVDCSPPGSCLHGDSPGKNTGVGCHDLFQGIFTTQGLKPSLLHCRQILYLLSHQISPWILEWAVYPFSKGSSQPRNWTRGSWIAGGFFASWTTREA